MAEIGVLGAGSWGTALAISICNSGNDVVIWSRNEGLVDSINHDRVNSYLPDIVLPEKIHATNSVNDVTNCKTILMVVPAQTIRENCESLKNAGISNEISLVLCCKGIEKGSQKLMGEVVKEVLPDNPLAILSGPNFAYEVAKGLPSCTTIACEDNNLGLKLLEQIGSPAFRTYLTSDVIGAQIGGAVKNVLAIACGIAIGKGLGENTRAAIVTRGIAEIKRLCMAKGGKAETLMGLSGIGDIMLTCGSKTSRNMSFGYNMGQGKTVEELTGSGQKLAEGVVTSSSVSELAKSLDVEMPICNAVNEIIFNGSDIDTVISGLLSRPLTFE